MLQSIEMTVNGGVVKAKVSSHMRLLDFLREETGLNRRQRGDVVKENAERAQSWWTVNRLIPVSCWPWKLDGREVLTVEGLNEGDLLDPIQQSIVDNSALQCGYCTPGIVMSAKGLLLRNPSPTQGRRLLKPYQETFADARDMLVLLDAIHGGGKLQVAR